MTKGSPLFANMVADLNLGMVKYICAAYQDLKIKFAFSKLDLQIWNPGLVTRPHNCAHGVLLILYCTLLSAETSLQRVRRRQVFRKQVSGLERLKMSLVYRVGEAARLVQFCYTFCVFMHD
jgi:hypothetical protein